MLLWFSCFGCWGNFFIMLQARCNHNDAIQKIWKRKNTHTKKQGRTNTRFRNTDKHPLLCLLLFLGSEAGLLWFSQSFLSLVLSWLSSLFAWFLWMISWFSLVFVVLLSGVLWLVLIALFFLGLLWIIALTTVNKISQSRKYHNTCTL